MSVLLLKGKGSDPALQKSAFFLKKGSPPPPFIQWPDNSQTLSKDLCRGSIDLCRGPESKKLGRYSDSKDTSINHITRIHRKDFTSATLYTNNII